jgi:hypothetical protein
MPNTSKLLFKSHIAIGFYVKTVSAHGSHLGWRSWSPDTILKVYYPRTIHAMFALNWLTGFRNKGNRKFTELRAILQRESQKNSEQSYKGKVKTHKHINRQNQSTTGKL